MTTDPGIFDGDPNFREKPSAPFVLDRATIRHTVAAPKPDNSAYLAAVKEFRAMYLAAERAAGGPISIDTIKFRSAK